MELLKKKNVPIEIIMIILLLVSMVILSRNTAGYVASNHVIERDKVVVLDAGHGGSDPGKIGINGALEKEINLSVTLRVKKLLEANDITVIMTRSNDAGLYKEDDENQKVVDLKNRITIMNEANPDLIVSIHQNSYEDESIHGAQVFYYKNSLEGKRIAELFQAQFLKRVDPDNHRMPQGNDTYYILKETTYPLVIVECGFLSNWKEADLLMTEAYQEKVAWAIHLSILEYLNE